MTNNRGQQIIALEEHNSDQGLLELPVEQGGRSHSGRTLDRLMDFNEQRIKEMDESGIDIQVLSQAAPSTQRLNPTDAAEITRGVNNRLFESMKVNPDRFEAFAALPTIVPDAAADELDRCVSELGFKGAMIHGLTNGAFIDEQRFWPIFERAEKLNVPIYLHPAAPHPEVVKAYYADYAEKFPTILGPSWGYTVETATQGLRLILSGLFEKVPDVKIIIGHLGESLPFMLWRIDQSINRPGGAGVAFRDIFCKNFYITTSGFFSDPAILCCLQEMGVEHVLFSVDWPFVENKPGTDWMESISLSTSDKELILNGNAKRILNL